MSRRKIERRLKRIKNRNEKAIDREYFPSPARRVIQRIDRAFESLMRQSPGSLVCLALVFQASLVVLPLLFVYLGQEEASAAKSQATLVALEGRSSERHGGTSPRREKAWEPPPDPALELFERAMLAGRDGASPKHTATGRFASHFDEFVAVLEEVDLESMWPIARGRDWVLVSGHRARAGGEPERVRVRVVRLDGVWKIDDLQIIPAATPFVNEESDENHET